MTRPQGTRFSKKYFNRVVKTKEYSRNCSVQSRTLRAIKLEKKMALPHFDKSDHSKDFQITYPTEIWKSDPIKIPMVMLFCLRSKNNYFKWLFLLNIARKFLHAFIAVYFNKWNGILGIGLLKLLLIFQCISFSQYKKFLSLFKSSKWNQSPIIIFCLFVFKLTPYRICFSLIYKSSQRHWWNNACAPSCSPSKTARICPNRILPI